MSHYKEILSLLGEDPEAELEQADTTGQKSE